MADIQAATITGTKRGINTYIGEPGVVSLYVVNSAGNIEGWVLHITPENARQLAGDLETLADTIEADAEWCEHGYHRDEPCYQCESAA
jgi:hypothetical protein